jgi:hypothetical protein
LAISLGMIGDVEMKLGSMEPNNSCQKMLVEGGSRLETIEWGTPWSLNILSIKIWGVAKGFWLKFG